MNSLDPDFDWHQGGVWVAEQEGSPLYATMANTPHSCRASLLGRVRKTWGELLEMGFVIQRYVRDDGVPTLTEQVRVGEAVATSTTDRWRYPAAGEAAPLGVTVQLLTRGGVMVRGQWNDLGDYIAWAPMIKRDKAIEERIGL